MHRLHRHARDNPVLQIAVPSHGSNFMHPPTRSSTGNAERNCSTLTRVELHASLWVLCRAHPGPTLQYPHTGRTSCILLGRAALHHQVVDCSTLTRVELHASTFPPAISCTIGNCSTLTRVELHASLPIPLCPPDQKDCSTLTRVELHASMRLQRPDGAALVIAVPSHGSNFMHRCPPPLRSCRSS